MGVKSEWTELFDSVAARMSEDRLPSRILLPAQRRAALASIGHDLDRMTYLCERMNGAAAARRFVATSKLRDTYARIVAGESKSLEDDDDGKPLGFWSAARLQVAEIAAHVVYRWHRLANPGDHGVGMVVTESRPLTYWRVWVWCTCCGDLFRVRS